ncbi:hypothetical protein GINT2_000312 [Glugoides intestinalis]
MEDKTTITPKRSRYFIWTEHITNKKEYSLNDQVQYAVWQLEKGEKSGKLHYQGFLQLKTPKSLHAVKSTYFSGSAHLEIVKKKNAAIRYCQKLKTRVEGPWEFGENNNEFVFNYNKTAPSSYKDSTAKAKADIEFLLGLINSGAGMFDIMKDHNSLYKKYNREINFMMKENEKKNLEDKLNSRKKVAPCRVAFLTGTPGSGKSSTVDAIAHAMGMGVYTYEGQWWPSYNKEAVLFIDECVKGSISFTTLNKIIHRRQITAPIKGGHVEISPIDYIFIASNYEFKDLFRKQDSKIIRAVHRRIDLFCTFFLDRNNNIVTLSYERFCKHTGQSMYKCVISSRIFKFMGNNLL